MIWFVILGALATWLSTASAASFRVRELVQIPATPQQQVAGIQTDSHGNLIVAASVTLPDSYTPQSYGLVKKIDAKGNEIFSRLLPGAFAPLPVAVDASDDIYVAGSTDTPEQFPFTNRPGTLFLMKIRGVDGTIALSTSLAYGAPPTSITVDGSGQVILVGAGTTNTTAGAYSSPAGDFTTIQVSVVRYAPAIDQIVFAARYGGRMINCVGGSGCITTARTTTPSQVILDRQGNIWVAGTTNTADLPITADALKSTCGCGLYVHDGFLAKLSGNGTRLLYGTYIGTSTEGSLGPDGDDRIAALALDAAGHLWLAGSTTGDDFPVTANAIQSRRADADGSLLSDGFLAEYDPAENRLVYATYFGGNGNDTITNLQIGTDGAVFFAGRAESPSLPASASGFSRGTDFLASFDAGAALVSGLTRLVNGTTGSGLALSLTGLVAAGSPNTAAYLDAGDASGPALYGIANSGGASVSGQLAPGEVISLYGVHIGPPALAVADLSLGPAPTVLSGVQVLFDGIAAPVLYVQDDQINAIVPFGVAAPFGRGTTRLVVSKDGAESEEALMGVVAAAPEAFKTGALQAAALNEDGTVNSENNPAKPGSIISVFGTGFGMLVPAPGDGQILSGMLPLLVEPVQVNLDLPLEGQPLEITYAGPAPQLVAGAIQVNFRLPKDLVAPMPQFSFTVGGWTSGAFVVLTDGVLKIGHLRNEVAAISPLDG
jgi:uncharacterized protein (TIGR03437 family)